MCLLCVAHSLCAKWNRFAWKFAQTKRDICGIKTRVNFIESRLFYLLVFSNASLLPLLSSTTIVIRFNATKRPKARHLFLRFCVCACMFMKLTSRSSDIISFVVFLFFTLHRTALSLVLPLIANSNEWQLLLPQRQNINLNNLDIFSVCQRWFFSWRCGGWTSLFTKKEKTERMSTEKKLMRLLFTQSVNYVKVNLLC